MVFAGPEVWTVNANPSSVLSRTIYLAEWNFAKMHWEIVTKAKACPLDITMCQNIAQHPQFTKLNHLPLSSE